MTWERVRSLFEGALDVPTEKREAWLQRECGGDEDLLANVRALLDTDDATAEDDPTDRAVLLDGGIPAEYLRLLDPQRLVGEQLGAFRLTRILGSGGMGTVFEAEQEKPARRVALKVMRLGLIDPTSRQRFEYEADVLARLDHPGIARVHAAGTCQLGEREVPYLAMELVEDPLPLHEWVRRNELSAAAIAALAIEVCESVQAAHRTGIAHRDLKPGNILVDPEGRTRLIDFGIAHETHQSQMLTQTGQVMGTLQYMSPEQLGLTRGPVDTRTDVYSLGVILYELLTGEPPFAVRDLPLPRAAEVLRDTNAARPSTLSEVPPELDWIVLKCLEKEVDRRYGSASELADDLARFLRHEAVLAGPPSTTYRVRKFVRRHRVAVGVAAAFFVVLLSSTAMVWYEWDRAVSAEARASANADDAREAAFVAKNAEARASASADDARKAAAVAKNAKTLAEQRLQIAERERERAMRAEARASASADDAREAAAVAKNAKSLAEQRLTIAERERERLRLVNRLIRDVLSGVNRTGQGRDTKVADLLESGRRVAESQAVSRPFVAAELHHSIGASYLSLGAYEEAEHDFEEAQRLLADVPEDDLAKVNAAHGLGLLRQTQGRLDEAEPLLEFASEARRRLLGYENINTLLAEVSLASLRYRQARYKEADEILAAAMPFATANAELLQDPVAARIASVWMLVLAELGRPDEAIKLGREHLPCASQLLGDRHTSVLTLRNNLATVLMNGGRFADAIVEFGAVAAVEREVMGKDHPRRIGTVNNLATAYQRNGQVDLAIENAREALRLQETAKGQNDLNALIFRMNLGVMLETKGDLEAAEQEFLKILAPVTGEGRYAKTLKDHWLPYQFQKSYAQCLVKMGRHEEAEKLLVPAHRELERILGKGHRRTSTAREALFTLYDDWGKPAAAAVYRKGQ